jgi:hypothetical protein
MEKKESCALLMDLDIVEVFVLDGCWSLTMGLQENGGMRMWNK